jgi:DhnA family fructose-bisphosphate aldolase class Ia
MTDDPNFHGHWEHFFKDGKTVILPIDHGTVIPVPGLEDPATLIEELNPHVDGYVVNYGLGRACSDVLNGKGVCFRTDIYKPVHGDNPDNGSYRAFSVEDGLQVGANAVMNMCYPHHPQEDRIFRECASLVSECIDAGLPVILESLPYGIGCPEEYTVENISCAARFAAEIGADVVKTAYPTGGSVDEFKAIIDACMVPVVVLGGTAMGNDRMLFEMVRKAMDAGASGIAIGRNVWQHESPAAVARSLGAIVHEDASVESALKLMSDPV